MYYYKRSAKPNITICQISSYTISWITFIIIPFSYYVLKGGLLNNLDGFDEFIARSTVNGIVGSGQHRKFWELAKDSYETTYGHKMVVKNRQYRGGLRMSRYV